MEYATYMAKMQVDDNAVSSGELVGAYEGQIIELKNSVAGMTPEQIIARPLAVSCDRVPEVGEQFAHPLPQFFAFLWRNDHA